MRSFKGKKLNQTFKMFILGKKINIFKGDIEEPPFSEYVLLSNIKVKIIPPSEKRTTHLFVACNEIMSSENCF